MYPNWICLELPSFSNIKFHVYKYYSMFINFTIISITIMVSAVVIEDFFDLLEEFKDIFTSIQLSFGDEFLQCCNFYCGCGYCAGG